jgi:glycerol-3-phosphate dehydrogenase
VRPLYDDGQGNPSAVTRDYVFDLDTGGGGEGGDGAPLLNVFGGKITTFRKLAEHALDRLGGRFPAMGNAWTSGAPLPGGDLPGADVPAFLNTLRTEYPWLPRKLAGHYTRLYGTRTREILGNAADLGDLGRQFGPLLFEAEAKFLRRTEWATCAEDVLRRRTKHALHMTKAERAAFADWFDNAAASHRREAAS